MQPGRLTAQAHAQCQAHIISQKRAARCTQRFDSRHLKKATFVEATHGDLQVMTATRGKSPRSRIHQAEKDFPKMWTQLASGRQ